MLFVFKKNIKDILKIVLPVYFVETTFQLILFFLKQNNNIAMIHAVWVMLATTMLVIFSLYDLYRLVFTRDYFFFYTLKYEVSSIAVIKSVVYTLALCIFYILYTPLLDLNLLPKLLSISSFYCVNIIILLGFRSFSSKKIGVFFYVLCLSGITVIPTLIYLLTYYEKMSGFMIGATNKIENAKQVYNLIIPITIIPIRENFNELFNSPFIFNICLLFLSIFLFTLIKTRKFNW